MPPAREGAPRIVLDASAAVQLLVSPAAAMDALAVRLASVDLAAPAYLPTEVDSALRGLERGGRLTARQATAARERFAAITLELWPWEPLAGRAWELRANLTTYDAGYVALAETIGATLITSDAAVAGAPGVRCAVELVG